MVLAYARGYTATEIEIALLPLVFGLWQVALVFSLLNAAVLTVQTALAPHSFLKAVRQLPPAHWLEWSENALRIEQYWSIPAPVETAPVDDGVVTAP